MPFGFPALHPLSASIYDLRNNTGSDLVWHCRSSSKQQWLPSRLPTKRCRSTLLFRNETREPLGFRLTAIQFVNCFLSGAVALSVFGPVSLVDAAPSTYGDQRQRAGSFEQVQSARSADRAKEALQLLKQAQSAGLEGDYDLALQTYTRVTKQYGDLALAKYAQVGRALMLYQQGDAVRSILELDELELTLRGYAEVHAALAAMLYSEKPPALQRAELQWDLSSEFDTRYADLKWVKQEKHWPPAMLTALSNFLTLSNG